MSITLPGARGLFSHMQEALHHLKGDMVALTNGINQTLADFFWLAQDLERRPTHLYKLVLLHTTLGGYHDAFRYMCGGAVLPGPITVPRTPEPQPSADNSTPDPTGAHPIVWQTKSPK